MKVADLHQRLLKTASRSVEKFRVAAIGLNSRGVAIASATNTPRFQRKGGGVHAEARVMRTSPRSLKTIIICRLGATGDLLPIDPCPACARLAQKLGVVIKSIQ